MWFGTRDGLNRYNGQNIKIYKKNPDRAGSISSGDYIYAILEDKRKDLWIGTQQGLNRYLPESDSFEHILNDPADKSSISGNSVTCMLEDSRGGLWFGTTTGLNLLADPASRRFRRFDFSSADKELNFNEIYTIFEDRERNLWVGTSKGLKRGTLKNGKYTFITFRHSVADPRSLSANFITTITEDRSGNVWIGTETGGINLYRKEDSSFIRYRSNTALKNSLSSNNVRKIVSDKSGKLWIATLDGLNLFDPGNGRFSVYKHDSENSKSLNNNSIKEIYQDNNGSMWIGTMYGGINIFHPNSIPFTLYQSSKVSNSISSNIICAIATDSGGNVWVGTEGEGLNYLDRKTNTFKHYKNSPSDPSSLSANYVKDIFKDREENIWIGLFQGGLELFQPGEEGFKHYKHNPADPKSLSSNNITDILEDSQNRFWVGTSAHGLNLLDKRKQEFTLYTADTSSTLRLSSNRIKAIFEDSKKNLWVGTAQGLNLLAANSNNFRHFFKDEKGKSGLRSSYINCIYEDQAGRLWIGSYYGGLSLYNPSTQSFTSFLKKDGLPSDNVIGILEDKGNLWISTDNGLSKFNIQTRKFRNFNVKDGLPSNEFNQNSAYKDAGGDMFFGSFNGLIRFKPDKIIDNSNAPAVVFTELKLFNKPVAINGPDGILEMDISLSPAVTFSHDQDIFTIEFAALNFLRPEKNQYAYRLDGFEKDWNYVSVPAATYTNLPAGEYTFLVRGSNNDGMWSKQPARLVIRVLPPVWKTWWAYLIYACVTLGTLYLVIRFFRRQARLESDLYHEHLHNERQEELYQMKLDFFTKISHEIRTPLTLILAPLEKLVDITKGQDTVNRQLVNVKNNAERLLRLISELLDFRKTESGNMKLHVAGGNIAELCEEVFNSFQALAVNKDITFEFSRPDQPVQAYFDRNQLEKVLYNIIANAFKFTPAKGLVRLAVSTTEASLSAGPEKCVRIEISDNGTGISEENLQVIFDNFYQVENPGSVPAGWGIGLALAKNIVEQHKGVILVESVKASGTIQGNTSFKIILPTGKDHFPEEQFLVPPVSDVYGHPPVMETEFNVPGTDPEHPERLPVLLLVEDNDEVRGFIRESLLKEYTILESVNGLEGLTTARAAVPDLIISDVTMPGLDGLELCQKLKTDERTSHIPVILLTAKAAPVHHIEGLEMGADAYISKPFSVKILELNVRNLLSLREAIKRKFSYQVSLEPREKIIGSPDAMFLNKLMEIIENQMEDPEFGVAALVRGIGMSQTVLYRKIKALTDLSITDFIKTIRLKQAAQLLRQNKISISEVAFAVGFNDRKYFSKEFRKQYGKAPSAYSDELATLPPDTED